MTDAQAELAQVREALAAGPTPGEWVCYDDSSDGKTNRIEIVAIGKTVARIYRSVQEQDLPNARLIAACSPENIASILAHVDAQAAEIERLRERPQTCLWSRSDDDTDVWETACGNAFTINEGAPADNEMTFCCFCGRELKGETGGSDDE